MNSIPEIDLKEYEIVRNDLGSGTFGMVYLIKNKNTEKIYAAKETIKSYDPEDEKQDFTREILSYSKVKSPAILHIYGYSMTNFDGMSHPVIVMEFMTNGSLDKYFKEKLGQLTPKQKYIILLGTAIGMKTLHLQGIIHRDLKTGNILLDDNFYPHICDFGISFISDLTASQILMSTQVGTPLYQAPEILTDEPYTNKIDVYSFSLIAYQLFTNIVPFQGYKSAFKMQSEIIEGKRPDTKMIKDKKISEFIESMWSNAPNSRPPFDTIVEELLGKNYREHFGVTDDEVTSYLDLFDESAKLKSSMSEIVSNFRQKATEGDVGAMFQLAVIYDQGCPEVPIDKKKAVMYYRQACENGSQEAMLIYGRKLRKGEDIPADKEAAMKLYKEYADEGSLKAMNNYGLMLFEDGNPEDKVLAADYLKKAADQNHPNAAFKYGEILFYGDGVAENKELAFRYYTISAEQGNDEAAFRLGCMLIQGHGVKKSKSQALKMWKLAAAEGNIKAMLIYGNMRFIGDGIIKDEKEGAYYIKKAADLGNQDAKDLYEKKLAMRKDLFSGDLSSFETEQISDMLEVFQKSSFHVKKEKTTVKMPVTEAPRLPDHPSPSKTEAATTSEPESEDSKPSDRLPPSEAETVAISEPEHEDSKLSDHPSPSETEKLSSSEPEHEASKPSDHSLPSETGTATISEPELESSKPSDHSLPSETGTATTSEPELESSKPSDHSLPSETEKLPASKLGPISDSDSSVNESNSDDGIYEFISPDFSSFSIIYKRLVSPLLRDSILSCGIIVNPKDKHAKADIVMYDGSLPLAKYHDYNPSWHVNKIPGMNDLCRNQFLFEVMNQMKNKYPSIYQRLFPPTYVLPLDKEQLMSKAKEPDYSSTPFVLKSCRKSGIELIQDVSKLEIPETKTIAQPFIKPFLIDNHKFDIRVFVIITDLSPFTMYIYNECIANFCLDSYSEPTISNRSSYVINRKESGDSSFMSIRPGKKVLEQITSDTKKLWKKISKYSALAVLSIYDKIRTTAQKACKKNDESFGDPCEPVQPLHRFFHLLGIDFLIDQAGNPSLIAINDNPGMKSINEADCELKSELVKSELTLFYSLMKDKNEHVKNWKKIIPSKNRSVQTVLEDVMKKINESSPADMSLTLPSSTDKSSSEDDLIELNSSLDDKSTSSTTIKVCPIDPSPALAPKSPGSSGIGKKRNSKRKFQDILNTSTHKVVPT